MRRILCGALAAIAVSTAGPAAAQQAPTPRSVEDYLCVFAGQCGEQNAPEVTREGPDTRGFRLARRSPARAATPATAATTPISERTGGSPSVRQLRRTSPSAPRAVASAAHRAHAPARHAAESRADLSLSFELGSATLTGEARERATIFAHALLTPTLASQRFRIEGHTDSMGGRSFNLELSRRRAEAVAEFLNGLGVPMERLDVLGFGYDHPLPGASTRAAENRRVEAVLISGS